MLSDVISHQNYKFCCLIHVFYIMMYSCIIEMVRLSTEMEQKRIRQHLYCTRLFNETVNTGFAVKQQVRIFKQEKLAFIQLSL